MQRSWRRATVCALEMCPLEQMQVFYVLTADLLHSVQWPKPHPPLPMPDVSVELYIILPSLLNSNDDEPQPRRSAYIDLLHFLS